MHWIRAIFRKWLGFTYIEDNKMVLQHVQVCMDPVFIKPLGLSEIKYLNYGHIFQPELYLVIDGCYPSLISSHRGEVS